jgi:hypothetical protein
MPVSVWMRGLAVGVALVASAATGSQAARVDVRIGSDGQVAASQEEGEQCFGPGSEILFDVAFSNNDVVAHNFSTMITHPPEAPALIGSCVASLGTCTITPLLASWTATVPAMTGANAQYLARVSPGVPAATMLCFDVVFQVDGNTPIELETCLETNSDSPCAVLAAPALRNHAMLLLCLVLMLVGWSVLPLRHRRRPVAH